MKSGIEIKGNPIKLSVPIRCQACGHKFEIPVKDIRPGKTGKCTSCKAIIKYSGDDGKKIQDALDKLFKL